MRDLGNIDDLMLINDGTNPDKYNDDNELIDAINKGELFLKNFIYGDPNNERVNKKRILKGGVLYINDQIVNKNFLDKRINKYENKPLKLDKFYSALESDFKNYDLENGTNQEKIKDQLLFDYGRKNIEDTIDNKIETLTNEKKILKKNFLKSDALEEYKKIQNQILENEFKKNINTKFLTIREICENQLKEPQIIINKPYPHGFKNDVINNFLRPSTKNDGLHFEDAYIDAVKKFDKTVLNNNDHPFYSVRFNNKGEPLSKYLPYDVMRKGRNDELKCYVNIQDTLNKISRSEDDNGELYGPGVFIQKSKFGMTQYGNGMEQGRYTPLFQKTNGILKLYNVKDEKINQKVNSSDNVDLFMIYYLVSGLYELKLSDENLFDFKQGKFKLRDEYKFDMPEIEKKYKTVKDDHGKECFWIPIEKLNKI